MLNKASFLDPSGTPLLNKKSKQGGASGKESSKTKDGLYSESLIFSA